MLQYPTVPSPPAQSKPEVQAFFGLPDSEELLEKFQCTLVQSYACTNNHFTTPRLVGAAPPHPVAACIPGCRRRQSDGIMLLLLLRDEPRRLSSPRCLLEASC